MKKGIIIQARMGSTRLPGKSLCPILDKPLLGHVIERVKRVKGNDTIIVATSECSRDRALCALARELGVESFQGNEINVQERFRACAEHFGLDVIIRVTGDNPLIEPLLIDMMIEAWHDVAVDYIGYQKCLRGIGAELFTWTSFQKAIAHSVTAYDREHVTVPYYRQPRLFKTLFLLPPAAYQERDYHVSVDTAGDLRFVKALYERFCKNGFVEVNELFYQHDYVISLRTQP